MLLIGLKYENEERKKYFNIPIDISVFVFKYIKKKLNCQK